MTTYPLNRTQGRDPLKPDNNLIHLIIILGFAFILLLLGYLRLTRDENKYLQLKSQGKVKSVKIENLKDK